MIHIDETALSTWCIDCLPNLLDILRDDITPDASFESLGLDSANSVQFVLALEDHLHHVLDPNVVVDHPSIAALVRFLEPQESQSARPMSIATSWIKETYLTVCNLHHSLRNDPLDGAYVERKRHPTVSERTQRGNIRAVDECDHRPAS